MATKMNRVNLVVCQLLLMLLKCDCDPEWTRNAIFVTVEIEDEPMDNSLVEQLQKLTELGVDGVIITNSFSLMRVKSSTTSEMSKLDEFFLLLAEVRSFSCFYSFFKLFSNFASFFHCRMN